jgi:hypothetical protein
LVFQLFSDLSLQLHVWQPYFLDSVARCASISLELDHLR